MVFVFVFFWKLKKIWYFKKIEKLKIQIWNFFFFDFFKILNLKLQILEISKKMSTGVLYDGGGCPEIYLQLREFIFN